MKTTAFLIVTKKGFSKSTKTYPDLKSIERCVQINLNIPDTFFDDPPILKKDIEVIYDGQDYDIVVLEKEYERLRKQGEKNNGKKY